MAKKKVKHTAWKRTNVRCIETGVVYDGVRAAALAHNVVETGMTNHLAGRADSVAGFTFERIPKED